MVRKKTISLKKRLLAEGALFGMLFTLAACNGGGTSAVNGGIGSGAEAENEKGDYRSLEVDSLGDLPDCTDKRDGLEAYVAEESVAYVCMDEKWIKLSKSSSSKAKSRELSSSTDKDAGSSSSLNIGGPVLPEGGTTSSSSTNNNGGAISLPLLAANANASYATNMYVSWLAYHFTTLENEAIYYPTIASDYVDVFSATYMPAGRVIWSAQSSGSYKNICGVDDATVPAMKYRACTVSEGIGYGMLLAYFNGDSQTFDALWNYTRGMKAYYNTKLMPWITRSFLSDDIDIASATDADIDIATALILMHYKTKRVDYLVDALTIVNAIWEQEIQQSDMLIYSGNTQMWKTDPVYNLSYFSPVAIRLFARVDPSHNWNGVLDAMYTYMAQVQDAGTGVFPDWSDASGAAKQPPNGAANNTYWLFHQESVRIPWHIAWDYYWYQDARAKAILDKLNAFIVDPSRANGDPTSTALATIYSWNLSVGADKSGIGAVPNQWLAAWCLTGISGNMSWLNNCTTAVNVATLANTTSSYYSDILLATFSQLLNGLYVRPY